MVSNPVQVSLIFILFLNRFLYTQFPALFMCRYEFVFDFDKSVNILVHTFFTGFKADIYIEGLQSHLVH